MFYTYEIKINGQKRYIGMTSNIERRKKEHSKAALAEKPKKLLYKKMQELENPEIEYAIIAEHEKKSDCARYEAMLILQDYFAEKELWQSPPFSFRYF